MTLRRARVRRGAKSGGRSNTMYESRTHPPLTRRHFGHRLLLHFLGASALVLGSLAVGMAGYAHYENLPWRDAFLNSAMLLGGMGPVATPITSGGKLFAGLYALYAGLVFLVAAAILVAPVVHRLLHKFHWEADGSSAS
jgi:hypothetical protein